MKRVAFFLAIAMAWLPLCSMAEEPAVDILNLIASIPDNGLEETLSLLEQKLGTPMKEISFPPYQRIYLPENNVDYAIGAFRAVPFLEVDRDAYFWGVYVFFDSAQSANFMSTEENSAYNANYNAWTMQENLETLPSLLELWNETYAIFGSIEDGWMITNDGSMGILQIVDGRLNREAVEQWLIEQSDAQNHRQISSPKIILSLSGGWHLSITFGDAYGYPPEVVYVRYPSK